MKFKLILFQPLMLLLFLSSFLNRFEHSLFQNHAIDHSPPKKGQNVSVMFYNVENLYDPYDDSTKLDDDFTTAGMKHWSYSRFKTKLNHLFKTIMAVGQYDPPAIIGFCETENRYVLSKLIYETPLKNFRYKIIQHESPDLRGIDVSMIYRPDKFTLISSRALNIVFPFDTTIKTRDVLYVKGLLLTDTFHILVNHWPSRRGGLTESQPRRNHVAGIIRSFTDSLFSINPLSKIIIMGDFNDEPGCISLLEFLRAKDSGEIVGAELINLMFRFVETGMGTHKFQGHWGILDQFIVSEALLDTSSPVYTTREDVHIFTNNFLSEDDEKFFGKKPLRTYSGPRYTGGFSDHLPIYLIIKINGNKD